MKSIILFSVFFSSLCLISCTSPIELKTNDSEPVIVIYGFLNEYTNHQTIKISSSSPYFEEKRNQPVSDARVAIKSSGNETFELEESANEKGTYRTIIPMAGKAGVTYQLTVEVDFDNDGIIETYEAFTTMPRLFEPDSIKIETMSIMGYKHYALNLYGEEEAGKDYYLCKLVVNDTIERFKISQFYVFSDKGIDDAYIDGLTLTYINDMEDYDEDDADALFVEPGNKITLCSSRIEKGYFDFIEQCQSEKWGENPFFGGPASNITTNISNGGVGYFTAFYTSVLEGYIP